MSGESEVVLCPECLFEAVGEIGHRKCSNPQCGAIVDKGDWPEIMGYNGLAPWSPANLVPPVGGVGAYTMPAVSEAVNKGALRNCLQYEFRDGQQVVYIGSSYSEANVEIEGAAPLHAVLLRQQYSADWWIYDCGSPTGTYVQDCRVHCRKLSLEDVITIVGVRLEFLGDRLVAKACDKKEMS